MNIKGKSRAGGQDLADHLMNAQKNEKVTVVRVSGTVAQDLHGAFAEMEAIASGTRAEKPLYHAKISPDPKEPRLTPQQWDRATEALAKELGMEGHAYALVLHQKYGRRTPDSLREHGHVVWLRINPDTMRTAHDGHNYRKHEVAARQLESEFGHARIQGAHVERNGQPRPERTPPEWVMQAAAKSGIDPGNVASTVKALWPPQDASKFVGQLKEEGLTLAIGKRDLVVLDPAGNVHTLTRTLGVKVAEIRHQLAGLDRSALPTVEQAREAIRAPKVERETPPPVWDRDADNTAWMDAVIDAAIGKEKVEGRFVDPKPEPGTLPRPARDSEPAELAASPQPESRKETRVRELLQKYAAEQKQPEPLPDLPAHEKQALEEKLTAFGFDASKPETLSKWRELSRDVDAGRTSEKDRLRDMGLFVWHQADKERRASHQPEPDKQRGRDELDRDR